LAPVTVRQHVTTAAHFLTHLDYELRPEGLALLTPSDVEAFVRAAGEHQRRVTLQHTVAHLRGFLRFLASGGRVPPNLDGQIDTPRVYRQEQLPRSLPWPAVRRLLQAIDRGTAQGLRDYTMLFLIATYGLRACEVVALTLDAIDWRGRRLHVPRRKTSTPLVLPLTDAAGTVLLRYLRRGGRARVFSVDILACPGCGSRRQVIAVVMDPSGVRALLEARGLPGELPA
jgi:integrase